MVSKDFLEYFENQIIVVVVVIIIMWLFSQTESYIVAQADLALTK